jgi:hypothetical protein
VAIEQGRQGQAGRAPICSLNEIVGVQHRMFPNEEQRWFLEAALLPREEAYSI